MPPTVLAPKTNAPVLVVVKLPPTVAPLIVRPAKALIETALEPVLESVTPLANALFVPLADKLIVLAPAVNEAAPVTANAPVCEIAPPLLAAVRVPAIV